MKDRHLASCPFCFSNNVGPEGQLSGGAFAMMCYDCGCKGPLVRTEKLAIEKWNNRKGEEE